jgi:hypothetical protein
MTYDLTKVKILLVAQKELKLQALSEISGMKAEYTKQSEEVNRLNSEINTKVEAADELKKTIDELILAFELGDA